MAGKKIVKEYVTTARAEEISGFRANTWAKWCHDGLIDGAQLDSKSNRWHIPLSEVLKHIKPRHTIPKDL